MLDFKSSLNTWLRDISPLDAAKATTLERTSGRRASRSIRPRLGVPLPANAEVLSEHKELLISYLDVEGWVLLTPLDGSNSAAFSSSLCVSPLLLCFHLNWQQLNREP